MEAVKVKPRRVIYIVVAVFLSAIIRAIGIHSFIIPNGFAPGGVTGLAAIFEHVTALNSGIFLFALNIPLIIIAFIFINKTFALKTCAAILATSLILLLLEKFKFPVFNAASEGADQVLPAIAGGLMNGLGVALLLKVGGSSGGTDVIATLIQRKYSATNVAWFIFALDSIVVVASVFVYKNGLVPILLAFIEMFASSKVVETISQGFKAAVKFEVITSRPEELSNEIITKMRRGVTMINATGMYTHEDKGMLICIVRKRQVTQFRDILKKYPDAFAYISATTEVVGIGFSS